MRGADADVFSRHKKRAQECLETFLSSLCGSDYLIKELEVDFSTAPFDTQDFGGHQDVPRHQAKIFISEITHRGIEIATAHAGMQIGDAVLPVIGRGVLEITKQQTSINLI